MSLGSLFDGGDKELAARFLLAFAVLFCRIGACLMLAPGVSMAQIPVQVRLFVAVAITISLTPALLDVVDSQKLDGGAPALARMLLTEIFVGGLIGLLARLFLLALQALFTGVATMLGFANPFGVQVEVNEVLPPLATFITLAATALIFITDMHWEILRGLVASYAVIPLGRGVKTDFALRHLTEALCQSFWLSLRIASPFFLYAGSVNLAIALVSRLTPRISIFYISSPFVLMGGLFLLYLTVASSLAAFDAAVQTWMRLGG
jgi:flagellar biosynthesis protein FliR